MSSVPNNIFEEVEQIANMSVVAIKSVSPVLMHANYKPEQILAGPGSRSASARYFKQGRSSAVASLTSNFEGIIDRFDEVAVNQQASASLALTDSQVLYETKGPVSVDEAAKAGFNGYLKPKLREIGQFINNNVIDVARTKTWRYYGSPSTPINTYNQLVKGVNRLRLYGSTGEMAKAFLPMSVIPDIIQNGMSDFATKRNDSDAYNWELSTSYRTDWFECDFMPQQEAGNVGKDGLTLTVVSVATDANGGVTSITFSGAGASDNDAIKAGDKFTFQDNVSGHPNLRMVQFVGHGTIMHPVQNCVVSNAASDGSGIVTVTLVEPLQGSAGQLQNINHSIVAGMQVKFEGDHTVGFVMQGNPLLVAMADLPSKNPFSSASVRDPDTGVSLRLTYGSAAFTDETGWAYNALYGKGLDGDNVLAYLFPPVTD